MTPLPAFAQDRRTVAEPVYPAPCIVLEAQLRAGFDEARTDTARIQKGAGRLRARQGGGAARGWRPESVCALDLRKGVTLLVDKVVTLYASRDPRDYGREPGIRGTITERGHGCRALINGDGVEGAAVMGDRRTWRREDFGSTDYLVGSCRAGP
jgi:polygalacturonase